MTSAITRDDKAIYTADAHKGEAKRFVVQADELLTAFIELENTTRSADQGEQLDKQPRSQPPL